MEETGRLKRKLETRVDKFAYLGDQHSEAVKKLGQAPRNETVSPFFLNIRLEPVPFFHSLSVNALGVPRETLSRLRGWSRIVHNTASGII